MVEASPLAGGITRVVVRGVGLAASGFVLTNVLTMVFYLASLAFFRCPDFDAAGVMLRAMAGQGIGAGTLSVRGSLFVIGTAAALMLTWLTSRRAWSVRVPLPRLSPIAWGAAASTVIVIASLAAPAGSEAFFYFQF